MIRKVKINFMVDSAAFLALVFVISTGVLMRYTLPPESGHFLTLWGMNRHEWGNLHFWIAVAFLIIMSMHLFLHWGWIINLIKGRKNSLAGYRIALACVSIMGLTVLAAAPFVVETKKIEKKPQIFTTQTHLNKQYSQELKGSMTLGQISKKTGIPEHLIIKELGIEDSVDSDIRLGKLSKRYNFSMQEIREAINKHLSENRED